ncbi:FeoA family protein [Myroides sp. LJL119]
MNLLELKKDQVAQVVGIDQDCSQESFQRFLDLGFVKGAEITIHNISPLGDPIAYRIYNTIISIRNQDAKKIYIQIS